MLKIQNNLLIAGNKKFAFPAVRLSIGSKVYEISGEGKVVAPLVRSYAVEGLTVHYRSLKLK